MDSLQEKKAAPENTDQILAEFVKSLGYPVSTVLLNSSCSIFQIPQVHGLIGYHLAGNCAVAVGDPMCLPENIPELTHSFHLFCRNNQWTVVYLMASDSFAHWAMDNGCHSVIQVGEELILDPTSFQKNQKLRWKINHSFNHGVVIKEYQNFDPDLISQMQQTIEAWLKARRGPQIYLGNLNLFTNGNRRIFYAWQENKIVGLLIMSRIERFQGWVINSFLSHPDLSLHISEHLMCSACETLAHENCHFLCIGAVAGSQIGEMEGLNLFARFLFHLGFRFSRWFFRLDAKKVYLNKYRPNLRPTYIVCNEKLGMRELLALKKILNVKL